MRKLFYMGLEPYESRYTLQLTAWSKRTFAKRNLNVVYVEGSKVDDSNGINVGQVLDAYGRSYYSMSQMMNLISMMRIGDVNSKDCIFFEDMFSPGIESLPYIMNQIPESDRPKIFVRCLAQSIDPDDFVHTTGMFSWMRDYEKMVSRFTTILATCEEMVANLKIAGFTSPIYNISGLAFDKSEVVSRVLSVADFSSRPMRVGFAARWDVEKQPNFYMDLVEQWHLKYPDSGVEFCVYSGKHLVSNDEKLVDRAYSMKDKLKIFTNLSKNEYYDLLNSTRVLFNCALQDWISNTVSEADSLGSNVLYPAYRSFPEVFFNDPERLYIPWSIDDAMCKLENLLRRRHKNYGKISEWNSNTVDRCVDIMEGKGEMWNRSGIDYRKFV